MNGTLTGAPVPPQTHFTLRALFSLPPMVVHAAFMPVLEVCRLSPSFAGKAAL
jgi:hypothetical protein